MFGWTLIRSFNNFIYKQSVKFFENTLPEENYSQFFLIFELTLAAPTMELKFNIVEGNSSSLKRKNEVRYQGMDAVHNPEERHWIGPKLNLKEYFARFQTSIVDSREDVDINKAGTLKNNADRKKIKSLVNGRCNANITEEVFAEISETCDIDNFT